MALKLLSNVSRPGCSLLSICLQTSPLSQSVLRMQNAFHTSSLCSKVEGWLNQNDWVYPPLKPGEERRPAWVCHVRENIKYSPKKMWYVACLVRGMSVDEAIKQLSFVRTKGAHIAKEVIEEAQNLAVQEHNVEYKSNLWVESFVGKGQIIKGIRKHAKMRFGIIHYRYCHYFVRLVEGPPPKHYYTPELTGNEKLEEYFAELRARRIHRTL
ncbi:39S ribosomal protein L22, mitochondrial-like isoform X2 [Stegodyphus dumicola]|uniref:39S ribosomal protein L22, mitochondrial-like isoform X2 n=1 Tax=Stegodyphus dumicola TaxID=202533 RepID=UPI0015AB4778|nr:39S ribosomal protein L22, mitochondrial-like isoform X2 [Stegodyphus dumicola]